MPQPDEPYYTSQQINIPPELPDILKQFTKAAIRTQPKDVLAWSAAYFRSLANGDIPPVKERLELATATQRTDTGLTPGLLRVLHRQLGPKRNVDVSLVEEKWKDLMLPKEQFDELLRIGNLTGVVEWYKFLAVGCSALAENITKALKIACEILTADPEGGASRVPFPLFRDVYKFLASIDGEIREETVQAALNYLQMHAERQDGFVQPRNLTATDSPSLSG